jgi:hypothetical protein
MQFLDPSSFDVLAAGCWTCSQVNPGANSTSWKISTEVSNYRGSRNRATHIKISCHHVLHKYAKTPATLMHSSNYICPTEQPLKAGVSRQPTRSSDGVFRRTLSEENLFSRRSGVLWIYVLWLSEVSENFLLDDRPKKTFRLSPREPFHVYSNTLIPSWWTLAHDADASGVLRVLTTPVVVG